MHITTIALIISIMGLASSFFVIGIIPSIMAFILNLLCIKEEKSIRCVRSLSISFVGILLPIVMYLNSYGFHMPFDKPQGLNFLSQIVYDNYTRLGLDMGFMVQGDVEDTTPSGNYVGEDGMYYVSDGCVVSGDEYILEDGRESSDDTESEENQVFETTANGEKIQLELDNDSIFESIDSLDEKAQEEAGYGGDKKGASDDDMPSYGGLPLGVRILGQYFREDYHNCNPILVLKNETGKDCRFECAFTARDGDGNELATSNKTVEVVSAGGSFILEGRFDKRELGGTLPSMYEFLVSKRDPYENNMYEEIYVFGEVVDNSAVVTAQNTSKKKAKVDAYVLFFDGDELVDCIWMIPKNSGEVCIDPGSSAYIKGDAYYKFDRIETYYTAYEAVGE